MGLCRKNGWVGQTTFRTAEMPSAYESAIRSEEHRIALNGLTKDCIATARQKKERLRFSSKGVDALGTAKRYIRDLEKYGGSDKRTLASERVFESDIKTGLFEETEDIFSFLVQYPVSEDSEIVMGEMSWDELAARGTLDDSTEDWYQKRAFVETREAVLAGEMLRSGLLYENDIITISNTATAKNAGDYFTGRDLMIRRVSFNPELKMVEMDQLMMHSVSNEIVAELFARLGVEVDEKTVEGASDDSAKYLATQIKVKKGELVNGAADIAFMMDWIMAEKKGKKYLFGEMVDGVLGNPYAQIAEVSREKEKRRQKASDFLKREFLRFAKEGHCSKDQLREVYEVARSMVADIEGVQFVRSRYGKKAAEQFEKKQKAIESGNMAGAVVAESNMQSSMGDPSVCNTVFNQSSQNQNSNESSKDSIFCPRLPKPGEIARCPCCRERVVVAGTADKIACSKANCRLEDPKLRRKRIKSESVKKELIKNQKSEFKIFDFSLFRKARLEKEMRKKTESVRR